MSQFTKYKIGWGASPCQNFTMNSLGALWLSVEFCLLVFNSNIFPVKIGSAYWKSFLRFYLIFGYQLFSLWPLKFELDHQIFGVDRQLAT